MLLPHLTGAYWINTDKPGGRVYFVGGGTTAAKGKTGSGIGASDTYDGLTPERPLATISQAHTLTTSGRGDTIVVLPGNVTLTSTLTISNDDVTLMGMPSGAGNKASSITSSLSASADTITVTGSNVVIEDLYFPAATAATTAIINLDEDSIALRNCVFNCGANNVETITVTANATENVIEGCYFYVTANGPDAAIEIEATGATHLRILNNVFDGGSDSNAWDAAAINSGVAHTLCVVKGNINNYGAGVVFSAAATGVIAENYFGEGTLGSMLDPGSCMCFENYEADAIDETGRIFPTSAAS